MNEEKNSSLSKIDWYAQECVFSKIIDYEKDTLGKQDKEEHDYYVEMIDMMKKYSKALMIEYTKDNNLIQQIKEFAASKNISYYISDNIYLW